MLKKEFQVQEISSRGHKRSAAEAFNEDISKVLVELITNSCDSYKRSKEKYDADKKIIRISYDKEKRVIEVIDNGEGINYDKKGKEKCFKEIMRKGEKTSGREEGHATRGFHGIGLKDVCIAMSNKNKIVELVSIRDKKISVINYGFNAEENNFGYWPEIKDLPVKTQHRNKYSIRGNGFYVKFNVPRDWIFPEIGKISRKLSTHRELRKILEMRNFKIFLNSDLLTHDSPLGEIVDSGSFEIEWKRIKFKIDYILKLSETSLEQKAAAWRDRIGGILIYHSSDAVLDLNLFSFNNDDYAAKIFGELEITTKKLEYLDKLLEDGVVDEKRKGLDVRKPFNKKLISILEKKLKVIVDEEKEKEKGKNKDIVDDKESKKILDDVNNLIKSVIGKAINDSNDVPSWRPVDKPFAFFPSNTEVLIKELEERNIYLIINKKLLGKAKITLTIDCKEIDINPMEINSEKGSADKDGYLLKKISLYSQTENSFGKLIAKTNSHEENILVRVIENEKIHPEEDFEFIPNKIKIIKGKPKFIELIFNEKQVSFGTELKTFSSSKDIKIIKSPKNIHKSYSSKLKQDVYCLKIKVEGNKIGTSAKISAIAGDNLTKALVEVVEERDIKRKTYLEKIEFKETADPIAISQYNENEKTITLYLKHPVILQHRRNIGEDIKIAVIGSQDLILLLSDIITRTVASLLAKERNKQQIGEIQVSSQNDFELTFNEMYREHGTKLSKAFYDIVINYVNKQIEDIDGEVKEDIPPEIELEKLRNSNED